VEETVPSHLEGPSDIGPSPEKTGPVRLSVLIYSTNPPVISDVNPAPHDHTHGEPLNSSDVNPPTTRSYPWRTPQFLETVTFTKTFTKLNYNIFLF
jgi:hypothetical protein